MNTSDIENMHLSGPVLEAIATGEAPESADRVHLEGCAACRKLLDAVRDENRVFSAELSVASFQESSMTAATNVSRIAAQSHKPLLIYAAAASIMIVAALGLIALRATPNANAPKPANDVSLSAAAAHKDVHDTPKADDKADNPKPKPEQPPANGEVLYEGKTAIQWLDLLDTSNPLDAGAREKMLHALKEIGRDGLPQILQKLRSSVQPDTIYLVLRQIDVAREDLPQFMELLKDSNFAVRKAGVQLLKNLGESQPGLTKDIQAALTQALNDRDKAVAEAARDALQTLTTTDKSVKNAYAALQINDFVSAKIILGKARESGIHSPEFDKIEKQIDELAKKQNAEAQAKRSEEDKMARAKADAMDAFKKDYLAKIANLQNTLAKRREALNAALIADPQSAEVAKLKDEMKALEMLLEKSQSDLKKLQPDAPALPAPKRTTGVGEGNIDD